LSTRLNDYSEVGYFCASLYASGPPQDFDAKIISTISPQHGKCIRSRSGL